LTAEQQQESTENDNHNHNHNHAQNEDEDEFISDEIDDQNNNFSSFSLVDRQAKRMRKVLNARRRQYTNIKHDINAKTHSSKFVTVVDEQTQAQPQPKNSNSNSDNNNNNSETEQKTDENNSADQRKKRQLNYSFGVKFYYWKKFLNNTKIDKYYNGGEYQLGFWYISQKMATLKEEILSNNLLPIDIKAEIWFGTECVKNMCDMKYGHGRGEDYNIERGTPPTISHVLAITFYTNVTVLCTLFSKGFRRIPNTESDASLKLRNSVFREWSRLLIEMVHVYGTMMKNSNIDLFYHGISVEVTFSTTFAVFCSPTSTTDS
jgi:hypothetical protein